MGDHEAHPLAGDHVLGRHPDVGEADLRVALVVGVAEHRQVPQDLDARGIQRHEDHRLLLVGRGVRVGLAHHDQDPAVGVIGVRGPPLAPVQDVLVAVALDAKRDVGRI